MHSTDYFFLLSCLACWRLAHLLSKEDGPFDFVFLLRKKLGKGFLGQLLDCFYCTSVWVAFPFAVWIGIGWKEVLLTWAALSGAACLLEQATASKNPGNVIPDYQED